MTIFVDGTLEFGSIGGGGSSSIGGFFLSRCWLLFVSLITVSSAVLIITIGLQNREKKETKDRNVYQWPIFLAIQNKHKLAMPAASASWGCFYCTSKDSVGTIKLIPGIDHGGAPAG